MSWECVCGGDNDVDGCTLAQALIFLDLDRVPRSVPWLVDVDAMERSAVAELLARIDSSASESVTVFLLALVQQCVQRRSNAQFWHGAGGFDEIVLLAHVKPVLWRAALSVLMVAGQHVIAAHLVPSLRLLLDHPDDVVVCLVVIILARWETMDDFIPASQRHTPWPKQRLFQCLSSSPADPETVCGEYNRTKVRAAALLQLSPSMYYMPTAQALVLQAWRWVCRSSTTVEAAAMRVRLWSVLRQMPDSSRLSCTTFEQVVLDYLPESSGDVSLADFSEQAVGGLGSGCPRVRHACGVYLCAWLTTGQRILVDLLQKVGLDRYVVAVVQYAASSCELVHRYSNYTTTMLRLVLASVSASFDCDAGLGVSSIVSALGHMFADKKLPDLISEKLLSTPVAPEVSLLAFDVHIRLCKIANQCNALASGSVFAMVGDTSDSPSETLRALVSLSKALNLNTADKVHVVERFGSAVCGQLTVDGPDGALALALVEQWLDGGHAGVARALAGARLPQRLGDLLRCHLPISLSACAPPQRDGTAAAVRVLHKFAGISPALAALSCTEGLVELLALLLRENCSFDAKIQISRLLLLLLHNTAPAPQQLCGDL